MGVGDAISLPWLKKSDLREGALDVGTKLVVVAAHVCCRFVW